MSDIVERLRARSFRLATSDFNAHGAKLAFEAADEIEKLRAALKQCDEAMAWELGGEPIDTLMIDARRAAGAALKETGE